MKRLLLVLTAVFLFNSSPLLAQFTVANPTMTPAQLVQNILIGNGINAFNFKYNGSATKANQVQPNVKNLTYTGTTFPMSNVVFMGTEGASSVNNDPDLAAIANGSVTNGAIIEFDFVPAGDTLSFNYIFASAEYSSYTCSNYNDAFGFFISGPGISGPYTNNAINIATVPGTNVPVAINTVNSGSATGGYSNSTCAAADPNWQNNSIYFTTSYNTVYPTPGNLDGFNGSTIKLAANSSLICGDTFHIKLAISNVVDNAFNSGVFLDAGSFKSDAVEVSVTTVSGDNTVIEGCNNALIYFTRPESMTDTTLTIPISLSGNAVEGTNYQNLPDSVFFATGQDSVLLILSPIDDGVTTGPDSVVITAYTVNQCGDTVVSQGTIYILDSPNMNITSNNPTVYCSTDSIQIYAHVTGQGKNPVTYQWNNGMTGDSINVLTSLTGPFDYYVTATDACGFSIKDTIHIDLQQTLAIDSLTSLPTKACKNTGAVISVSHGASGTPTYTWLKPDSSYLGNSTAVPNLGSGWYYFSVKDNKCKLSDSVFVDMLDAPKAIITPDKNSGCNPTTFTLANASQNAVKYQWNVGQGYYTVNDASAQSITLTATGDVSLAVTDADGECPDTTTITLSIVNCGCTDPKANNYDGNATLDDGSCVFAPPTIILPNIFTPNADNLNDFYVPIDISNASKLEFWILNRWGELMYHYKLDNGNTFIHVGDVKGWDGKVKSKEASDGVYFVKYTATGLTGQEVKGQTFFNLSR